MIIFRGGVPIGDTARARVGCRDFIRFSRRRDRRSIELAKRFRARKRKLRCVEAQEARLWLCRHSVREPASTWRVESEVAFLARGDSLSYVGTSLRSGCRSSAVCAKGPFPRRLGSRTTAFESLRQDQGLGHGHTRCRQFHAVEPVCDKKHIPSAVGFLCRDHGNPAHAPRHRQERWQGRSTRASGGRLGRDKEPCAACSGHSLARRCGRRPARRESAGNGFRERPRRNEGSRDRDQCEARNRHTPCGG